MIRNHDDEAVQRHLEHLQRQEKASTELAEAHLQALRVKKQQLDLLAEKLIALRELEAESKAASQSTVLSSAAKLGFPKRQSVSGHSDMASVDTQSAVYDDSAFLHAVDDPAFEESLQKLRRQEEELKVMENQLLLFQQMRSDMSRRQNLISEEAKRRGLDLSQPPALNKENRQFEETQETNDDGDDALHIELRDNLLLLEKEFQNLAMRQEQLRLKQSKAPSSAKVAWADDLNAPQSSPAIAKASQSSPEPSVEELMNRLVAASVREMNSKAKNTQSDAAESPESLRTRSSSIVTQASQSIRETFDQEEDDDEEEHIIVTNTPKTTTILDQEMDDAKESDEEEDFDVDTTSLEIQKGIEQILAQLAEIEQARHRASTPKDQLYIEMVTKKLTEQLEELRAVEAKIKYYQTLLSEQEAVGNQFRELLSMVAVDGENEAEQKDELVEEQPEVLKASDEGKDDDNSILHFLEETLSDEEDEEEQFEEEEEEIVPNTVQSPEEKSMQRSLEHCFLLIPTLLVLLMEVFCNITVYSQNKRMRFTKRLRQSSTITNQLVLTSC